MSIALVYNNQVVPPIFDDIFPAPLKLADGLFIATSNPAVPWVGTDGFAGYKLLPVQYDTPPANSQETGRSYSIVDNVLQVTRTWQAVYAPQVLSVYIYSASTPSVNAAYSLTQQSLDYYRGLMSQVQISNVFPTGSSSVVINDVNGVPHSVTASVFSSFYNAVSHYAEALSFGQAPLSILNIL